MMILYDSVFDISYNKSYTLSFFDILSALFCQIDDLLHVYFSCFTDKFAQESCLVSDKLQRSVVLFNLSSLEDQDLIVVDDGVQSMGNRDDSGLNNLQKYVFELGSDHMLDQLVSLFVDACCSLVHEQHFRFTLNKKRDTMRARAIQISCFCPREKLDPESSTLL